MRWRAIRCWLIVLGRCLYVFPAFGQAGISVEPQSQSIVGIIGQGNLVTGLTVNGIAVGVGNTTVKFKLVSITNNSDNFLVVSPSSGTTPATVYVGVNPNFVGTVFPGTYPISLNFTTTDQTPPSTSANQVIVTLDAPNPPVVQSVVNSASFQPVITPGGMVSILGTSLAPSLSATFNNAGLFPTSLANATVTFNGVAAPILSTSPGQINAVAPYEIAGQKAVQVVVTQYPQTTFQQSSPAFSVPEIDNSLALFATPQNGTGQPGILNCGAQSCSANSAANPAPPGSIVVMFANGGGIWNNTPQFGPGTPHVDGLDGSISILAQIFQLSQVSLTIGGRPATLLYAGAAPYQVWGILQVNALVPTGLGSGPQPVVLTIGQNSTASQQATVCVQ